MEEGRLQRRSGLRRYWGRKKVPTACWEREERIGAWLDHDLELHVEEMAGTTRACLDAARQRKRKRHRSMDFAAI
jgi:hypothetical protein